MAVSVGVLLAYVIRGSLCKGSARYACNRRSGRCEEHPDGPFSATECQSTCGVVPHQCDAAHPCTGGLVCDDASHQCLGGVGSPCAYLVLRIIDGATR